MNNELDLKPDELREFFDDCILKVHPWIMTDLGFKCFDRFFKAVNCQEGKLIPRGGEFYWMNTVDLTGTEYIWSLISNPRNQDVAKKAIKLLKEMFTNLGPKFKMEPSHQRKYISFSFDRIQTIFHENVYDKDFIIDQEKDKLFECIWTLFDPSPCFDGRNWY